MGSFHLNACFLDAQFLVQCPHDLQKGIEARIAITVLDPRDLGLRGLCFVGELLLRESLLNARLQQLFDEVPPRRAVIPPLFEAGILFEVTIEKRPEGVIHVSSSNQRSGASQGQYPPSGYGESFW